LKAFLFKLIDVRSFTGNTFPDQATTGNVTEYMIDSRDYSKADQFLTAGKQEADRI
jgi:hypothetical protein